MTTTTRTTTILAYRLDAPDGDVTWICRGCWTGILAMNDPWPDDGVRITPITELPPQDAETGEPVRCDSCGEWLPGTWERWDA